MKINGGIISTGNLIVMATIVVSIAIAWGSMNTTLSQFDEKINEKADKDLIDYKIEVIMRDIGEIKDMLDIMFTNAK